MKGLPSGLEVFEEHIAFLIDAGGMWNGVGRVRKLSFSKIELYVSDIFNSWTR